MNIQITDKQLREAMQRGLDEFYILGTKRDAASCHAHNAGFKRGFDFAMDYIEYITKGEITYFESE